MDPISWILSLFGKLLEKIEKIKEIELKIKPVIIIDFNEQEEEFFIKNVGNGTAMNIKIDDVLLIEPLNLKYIFHNINAITPNEIKKLNYTAYINNTDFSTSELYGKLNPKYIAFQFVVTYYNIKEKEYISKFGCSKDGIKLIRKGKAKKISR